MAYSLPRKSLVLLALIVGLACFFWPARHLRSDTYVFYLADQRHIISSQAIGGTDYLPVLDLLSLAGKVANWEEKRNALRIRFGASLLELRLDKNRVKLNKTEVSLSNPVRISNGQWLVPSEFITSILPLLIAQPVRYASGTRSVFIGGVKPVSYSVRLDPIPNGARLTVQFTSPVNVRTISRNGKWVLYVGNIPVQPVQEVYHFDSPYVSELKFDDQDGTPKLIVTPAPGAEGLNFYIRSGPAGQSTIAELVKPPSTAQTQQAAQPAGGQAPTAPGSASQPNPVAPPAVTPPELLLPAVVLDAGHGGQDTGARSSNGVLEKDLVARLAENVRSALAATQKYRVVLTRVGDTNPGFDDRVRVANTSHPVAFVSLHAGSFGEVVPRVAVYTYQPSSSGSSPGLDPAADRAQPRRLFVPWDRVQEPHWDRSRQLAQALAEQFGKISGVSIQEPAAAPVRVLRSVDAPAVAVEIGSLAPAVEAGPLTDSNFLQQISTAIVQVLQAFQGGHA